jgi:YidC/Oxa1 family membrane protein insertase
VLNWLYDVVTKVVLALHSGLSPVFGKSSGWTWGLSVFVLTLLVRIVLFPLFVKQIKSQRSMSELAPRVKELQAKYKNDKERMNTEVMALYKEHGANPIMGCLPLLLQMPIFYALFHVLRYISEHGGTDKTTFKPQYGWKLSELQSAGHAKVFGVPLALGFKTASKAATFGANVSTVRIVTVIAIIVMATTTFLTQRQLMARNATSGNPMAQQQKMMLYILPPLFALFGLNFQAGVLIYWVTSNVWSLGQQHFVIKSMPVAVAGAPGKPGATSAIGANPGSPGAPKGGLSLSKAKSAPADGPPPSTVVIRRQQPTRPPRSKRDGRRPERPGSPR